MVKRQQKQVEQQQAIINSFNKQSYWITNPGRLIRVLFIKTTKNQLKNEAYIHS